MTKCNQLTPLPLKGLNELQCYFRICIKAKLRNILRFCKELYICLALVTQKCVTVKCHALSTLHFHFAYGKYIVSLTLSLWMFTWLGKLAVHVTVLYSVLTSAGHLLPSPKAEVVVISVCLFVSPWTELHNEFSRRFSWNLVGLWSTARGRVEWILNELIE